jgi:NAD(P)-dependent dehydrogenase (short-subunit alcohol dehydrogenase family)
VDRRRKEANEPKGLKFKVKIKTSKLDVSNDAQVAIWVADTVKEFGKLDGAANVAGIAGGDGDTTVQTIVRSAQGKSWLWRLKLIRRTRNNATGIE